MQFCGMLLGNPVREVWLTCIWTFQISWDVQTASVFNMLQKLGTESNHLALNSGNITPIKSADNI